MQCSLVSWDLQLLLVAWEQRVQEEEVERQLFSPLSFPLFSLPSSPQVWDHPKQKKEDTDPFKASSCFTLACNRASIAFIRIMVDPFEAFITKAFASFRVVTTSIAIEGFKAITGE